MHISAIDACRLDLYTPDEQLRQKYPEDIAAKVSRIRAMHQWFLANPEAPDALCVREDMNRFAISKPTAYDDIRVLKVLMPMFAEESKEFHRWRYNEMILETYSTAKKKGDTRTMERASTSYAKHNKIDEEEKSDIPVDQVAVQGFFATDDPSVLGIKKIPNIRERQRQLLEKYRRETADIEDIEYEAADLEEDALFNAPTLLPEE